MSAALVLFYRPVSTPGWFPGYQNEDIASGCKKRVPFDIGMRSARAARRTNTSNLVPARHIPEGWGVYWAHFSIRLFGLGATAMARQIWTVAVSTLISISLWGGIQEPIKVEGGLVSGIPAWGWGVREYRSIPYAAPPGRAPDRDANTWLAASASA